MSKFGMASDAQRPSKCQPGPAITCEAEALVTSRRALQRPEQRRHPRRSAHPPAVAAGTKGGGGALDWRGRILCPLRPRRAP